MQLVSRGHGESFLSAAAAPGPGLSCLPQLDSPQLYREIEKVEKGEPLGVNFPLLEILGVHKDWKHEKELVGPLLPV